MVNKELMSYHKNCFKCIGAIAVWPCPALCSTPVSRVLPPAADCGLKLELKTYRVSDFGDPEVFCQKCVPKQAPSQTADTVETRRNNHATALFKDVGIVNEQVRTLTLGPAAQPCCYHGPRLTCGTCTGPWFRGDCWQGNVRRRFGRN